MGASFGKAVLANVWMRWVVGMLGFPWCICYLMLKNPRSGSINRGTGNMKSLHSPWNIVAMMVYGSLNRLFSFGHIRSENMHYNNASGWEGTQINAFLVSPGTQENARREVSIRLVLWDVEKKQDKHLFIDLKASISSHNRHYMQCISSLQSNMNTCCMPHIYTHYKAHNTKALSDAIWIKSLPQFMLERVRTVSIFFPTYFVTELSNIW